MERYNFTSFDGKKIVVTEWKPEGDIRGLVQISHGMVEHSLRYKAQEYIPQHISDELQRVATDIASLDQRMQAIHDQVDELSDAHGDSAT